MQVNQTRARKKNSKSKNQQTTKETHIIAHNLQPQSTNMGAGTSAPETIEAGNVKITIQQNKSDTAITIGKSEKNKPINKK